MTSEKQIDKTQENIFFSLVSFSCLLVCLFVFVSKVKHHSFLFTYCCEDVQEKEIRMPNLRKGSFFYNLDGSADYF